MKPRFTLVGDHLSKQPGISVRGPVCQGHPWRGVIFFTTEPSRLCIECPRLIGDNHGWWFLSGAHARLLRLPFTVAHFTHAHITITGSCAISITSPRSLFRTPWPNMGRMGSPARSPERASTRWQIAGESPSAGLSKNHAKREVGLNAVTEVFNSVQGNIAVATFIEKHEWERNLSCFVS